MATLLENINTARETTISSHYSAAVAELEEKVKFEPLKTSFLIYAGCVSEDVTLEIAHRFNAGGVKATPAKSGLVSTKWHIVAEPTLPVHLIHEQPKLTEEVKSEESKPEENSTESA